MVEASEEAGLRGDVGEMQVGRFRKRREVKKQSVLCEVQVFPLEVTRQQADWPERKQRRRIWVAPRKAAKLVKKSGLRRAIREFGNHIHRGIGELITRELKLCYDTTSTAGNDMVG